MEEFVVYRVFLELPDHDSIQMFIEQKSIFNAIRINEFAMCSIEIGIQFMDQSMMIRADDC